MGISGLHHALADVMTRFHHWLVAEVLVAVLLAMPLTAQTVAVRSDPRTELLTVIFRIAGSMEYNQCRVPAYAAAIDSAFGR